MSQTPTTSSSTLVLDISDFIWKLKYPAVIKLLQLISCVQDITQMQRPHWVITEEFQYANNILHEQYDVYTQFVTYDLTNVIFYD